MTFKEIWENGVKLKDIIDTVISHNEIVNLWYTNTKDNNGHYKMFHGMGWSIPDEYLELNVSKIIGIIRENVIESDEINILLDVDENGFVHDIPAKSINPEYSEYLKEHPLSEDWDGDYVYDITTNSWRPPSDENDKGDKLSFNFNDECDLLIGNENENASDEQYSSCYVCHRFDICKEYFNKKEDNKC